MANFREMRTTTVSRSDASIDQGLRNYMIGVYNLMAIGLVITAFSAMIMSWLSLNNATFAHIVYGSPVRFIIMFAPLISVLFLSFKIQDLSTSAARTLFIVYSMLVGLSMSSIFLVYTGTSISQTFFISAASFGSLSLYGYTTKRDLKPLNSFFFIATIGLLIAIFANIFLKSNGLQFLISFVGILIFAGLTAYDTQTIKEMYYENDSDETIGRKIVMGALNLYLDIINMFTFFLQIFGNKE